MLETVSLGEGKFMLIAELSNDQLVFHVKKRIQMLADLSGRISQGQDQFNAALYNRQVITPQDAGKLMRQQLQKLYPYLAELYLRQINNVEIVEALQKAVGRKEAVPPSTQTFLLDFVNESVENAEGTVRVVTFGREDTEAFRREIGRTAKSLRRDILGG